MADGIAEELLAANAEAKADVMASRGNMERWVDSPFEWIIALPSRTKGRAGELLVEHWLTKVGFTVTRASGSGHDRVVNGRNLEIKFSTLWEQETYTFQQLRDQDYELIFFLGLSPFRVDAWVVPKEVAFEHAVPQHGGASGSDTRWVSFPAGTPPDWLSPYGGSLEECKASLDRLLGS